MFLSLMFQGEVLSFFLQITAKINMLYLNDSLEALESQPWGMVTLPLPVIIVSTLLGKLPQPLELMQG